ncbi:undecaprenyldiphospho-muramoylpentapeptide beta-N-acetylglucosaminyltransferase [Pseudoalteromonas sp. R3]|uniref:undecaprenyldiphospho-muramoylpentapeptide beta-N-acetylglucosaminyltransferase n=1 Tax=Pseudoalteromonas sp. R3 TaxID=1709477 RepID=UPI0006B54E4F|nr:undecaprenyldiphospho-muramoylpentapeptide beta-N-acetylglucosaminyltransferase [Pseudoalteromonas sp. R3]AZZ99611.1 undecaprenyldiphospho-muramoylpentapeptide beta-N-acetylglucosaminyltransferase [Pseudoalteromonas sp. R3]
MTKRLLVVAGGTGGHIFPGIAVAKALAAQGWLISWVGTADRMEAQVVPAHDIEIDFIEVKGVRGNGFKRLLAAPWMVIKAIFAAKAIIRNRRPDVVLAMGGYVTGPVGLAAKLAGVPLVIHEQNAVAGLSNKLLARIANRVLAAFPQAFAECDHDVVGNPVRASVAQLKPKQPGTSINVLVVGGSLGAKVLNDTVPEAMALLRKATSGDIRIWHQSGKGNHVGLEADYQRYDLQANVAEFIDDMDKAYDWADVVICRAGALTVSEIAAAGKMAIFVPLPHAVDDHQTANARFLVDESAALLVPQSDLSAQHLCDTLLPYCRDQALIWDKANKAKACAQLSATQSVAVICEEVTN